MRTLLLALALPIVATSAGTASAQLLRCAIEDAREPVDGVLETSPIAEISVGREILFDTTRLELTLSGGTRWSMDLLQTGSSENDLVATRVETGPASTSQMVFRLRQWQGDMPFLFMWGWEVQSGRCRPF